MKKTLLIILTVVSVNAMAQVHSVGLQGGVNLTNLTANNYFHDSEYRTGFIAGFKYEYLIKGKYTLGADLLYSQQGFKEKLILTDQGGNPLDYTETKFYYDYLSLPLILGYTSGHRLKGFAKIGVYPSILLKAEIILPAIDINGISAQAQTILDVLDNVSKFDLGGLIELGGDYGLNNNLELFSAITYRQSLTTFSNSEYFKSSQMRHNGFSLSMGLKYNLNKRNKG